MWQFTFLSTGLYVFFGSVRLAVPFGMTYVAICSSLSFLSGGSRFLPFEQGPVCICSRCVIRMSHSHLRIKDVSTQVAHARNISIGEHRHCCIIRNTLYKDLYGKKPIVFVTYENERIQ